MIPRGTIVITALPGEYGKPRPAVVVQSNALAGIKSCVICPFTTSDDHAPILRPFIAPTETNGLEAECFVMVDKITAMPEAKLQRRIGVMEAATLAQVSRALLVLLDLA